MARWTEKRVVELAPDATSVSAARRLPTRRVVETGQHRLLVWGKCQGSGKTPYQVTVDLTEPAFRCTCPSRKFPCKHGAGAAADVGRSTATPSARRSPAADFADEWADAARRAAAERAARAGPRPGRHRRPRGAGQAARAERLATMTAGLDDLERWLGDLVAPGPRRAPASQPYSFWDATAARLVDAQLPGLAEQVRAMGSEIHRRDDWADAPARRGRPLVDLAIGPGGAATRSTDATSATSGRSSAGPAAATRAAAVEQRHGTAGWCSGSTAPTTAGCSQQRTWLWGEQTGRDAWWCSTSPPPARRCAVAPARRASVVDDEVSAATPEAPPRGRCSRGRRPSSRTTGGVARRDHRRRGPSTSSPTWLAANPWLRARAGGARATAVLVDDASGWWLQDAAGDRSTVAPTTDPLGRSWRCPAAPRPTIVRRVGQRSGPTPGRPRRPTGRRCERRGRRVSTPGGDRSCWPVAGRHGPTGDGARRCPALAGAAA